MLINEAVVQTAIPHLCDGLSVQLPAWQRVYNGMHDGINVAM